MDELGESVRVNKRDRTDEYKSRKRSPTYHSWNAMVQRCRNPKHRSFKDYGARGISFDPSWCVFSRFYADMGERPEGTTLDRIDCNENYSKANCRWADSSTQNLNRRPFKPRSEQDKFLDEWLGSDDTGEAEEY